MINQITPIWIDRDRLASRDDEHKMLRSCQSDVHSTNVGQETDPVTPISAHSSEDNDRSFSSLETVYRVDLHHLIVVVSELLREQIPQKLYLLSVWRYHSDSSLHGQSMTDLAKPAEDEESEMSLTLVGKAGAASLLLRLEIEDRERLEERKLTANDLS